MSTACPNCGTAGWIEGGVCLACKATAEAPETLKGGKEPCAPVSLCSRASAAPVAVQSGDQGQTPAPKTSPDFISCAGYTEEAPWLRFNMQDALADLERIQTEKLAAAGLPEEASAVSSARVTLDAALALKCNSGTAPAHCDDCDPSFTCWNSGADCRKRARTVTAPAPEAKDDPPFVAACNDAAHLAEAQYENLEAERRLLSNQAARIAELERLVEHLKTSILTLTNAAAQLTKERDEARHRGDELKKQRDKFIAKEEIRTYERDEWQLLHDTLRARVDELEKDRERLDWLEANPNSLHHCTWINNVVGRCFNFGQFGKSVEACAIPLRAAIDAAKGGAA